MYETFSFQVLKKGIYDTYYKLHAWVAYSIYSARVAWIVLIHFGRLGFIWLPFLRIRSYVTEILCLRHKNQTVNPVWVNDRHLLWYIKYVNILSSKNAVFKFQSRWYTKKPWALTGIMSMVYRYLTWLVFSIHCYPVLPTNGNLQKCHIQWYCNYVNKARWRI